MSDKYAEYRLSARPILMPVLIGAMIFAAALLVLYLLLRPFPETRRAELPAAATAVMSDARQRSLLNSYGWIDRERGIAHIPIAEAMRLVQQRYDPAGVDRENAQ